MKKLFLTPVDGSEAVIRMPSKEAETMGTVMDISPFSSVFIIWQSIPLLMVAAFGGYEHVMNAYEVAVNEGYLFGDYGDAMLIVD